MQTPLVVAIRVLHLEDVVTVRVARVFNSLPALQQRVDCEVLVWIRVVGFKDVLHFVPAPRDLAICFHAIGLARELEDMCCGFLYWIEACSVWFVGVYVGCVGPVAFWTPNVLPSAGAGMIRFDFVTDSCEPSRCFWFRFALGPARGTHSDV